jgi:hypothetical protein
MLCIATKFWGMGQQHVFKWRALPLNQNQGINYEVTHDHLSWFFELTIFMTIQSNIYNTTVIYYNSYQEFKFRLHYINNTLESIWRG